MNLSLGQLSALSRLAHLGTMTAVAEELGYTPGAVSQQIAALEKTVKAPLITKNGRKVALTDAGRVLVEHADTLLVAERAALDAVRNVQQHFVGPVSIGVFGSIAATLLPEVIAQARADYPQMRIRSCELDLDDVFDAVDRGYVDVAFGLDYPAVPFRKPDGVEIIVLRRERFALAVAPGAYGLTEDSRIDLRDAADWDWILPVESEHYGLAMRTACRQYGFEPRVAHEVLDTAATLAMVARGLGVSPATDIMLTLSSLPVARVAIAQDVLREVVLIRPAATNQRPTIEAITEAARHLIKQTP